MPATIPVERLQLSNGITVLLVQNDTADIVAGRLLLRHAGSRWESAAEGGLFHLLSTVLTKGTEIRDAFQIAEAIESVGAALSADATSDYFGLAFKCVTPDFPDLIKLAAELLRSPTFPTNEIEREKYVTLQNIRSQQEQPFNVAFQQLRDGLYGDHPYARSVLGTEETVRGLGQSQLMICHQQFFRPDNLVISLSGRLQRETVLDLLEAVFADWRSPAESMPTLQLPTPIARPDTFSLEQDSQQATVMLGYLAPSSHSPHYPVLKLVSSYLGSGLSSRL
ncbi:MAG: pitrilysin family protein, partial [Cyanobacteria bacterium P01_H01_bin.15]